MFDNLGRALYLLRDLRGKSQAEVAREAGIGKSQLSKYEVGRELPKLESLGKVLTVLDVGLFDFFYTMHVLDRQGEKLGFRRDAEEQPLPLPTFSGGGLLSGETDEAFQRVLRDVLALYQHMVREKLLNAGTREKWRYSFNCPSERGSGRPLTPLAGGRSTSSRRRWHLFGYPAFPGLAWREAPIRAGRRKSDFGCWEFRW